MQVNEEMNVEMNLSTGSLKKPLRSKYVTAQALQRALHMQTYQRASRFYPPSIICQAPPHFGVKFWS